MSPWEKRLERDRKEIFAEVKWLRDEATERLMPGLIARLEQQNIRLVDARQKECAARRAGYYPELLRKFVASNERVWGIMPGDKHDATNFRQRMARVIKQERADVQQRTEGVLIYLERA